MDAAEHRLRDYVAPVVDLKVDTLQQQLAAETGGGHDVLNPVAGVVEQIKNLNLGVAARSAVEWKEKGSSLTAAETVVSAEETRLTEHISVFKNQLMSGKQPSRQNNPS